MRRVYLSAIFLFLSTVSFAEPVELKTIFNNVDIASDDMQILFDSSKNADPNLILSEIKKGFPSLKIIILPASEVLPFPSLINWEDSSVSSEDKNWYLENYSNIISNEIAGFFLGPYETSEKLDGRPMSDKPIVFVRKNARKFVIKHEVLHYLVYRARTRKVGAPNGKGHQSSKLQTIQSLSKELDEKNIHGHPFSSADNLSIFLNYNLAIIEWLPFSESEEIDVINLLLANSENLNLSNDGAVSQIQYMVQNFHGISPRVQKLINATFEIEDARRDYVQIASRSSEILKDSITDFTSKYQTASEKVPFYARKFNIN